MKIKLIKPSNQFWSIFISTVIMLGLFWGMMMGLSSTTSTSGASGLVFFMPFVFLISLTVSYLRIYPRINRYLDDKYKTNSNKKKIRPRSLVLGIFLGFATEFVSRLLIPYYEHENVNYNLISGFQIILQIIFSVIWVKTIDKMINK